MRFTTLPFVALCLGFLTFEAAANSDYIASYNSMRVWAPGSGANFNTLCGNCKRDGDLDWNVGICIHLGMCFGNSDGTLVTEHGGAFGNSCKDVTLEENSEGRSVILAAECENDAGAYVSTMINTNDYIGNVDGELYCLTRSKWHDMLENCYKQRFFLDLGFSIGVQHESQYRKPTPTTKNSPPLNNNNTFPEEYVLMKFAFTSNPSTMSSFIYIRPASSATDDGLRLCLNFDSQLSWLSSIGSGAQWGTSTRTYTGDHLSKHRTKVEHSERGWDDPWSRDWLRAYIAEVELKQENVSSELLERTIVDDNDTIRLPLAGMILQGRSSEYDREIIPENDDNDPFIFIMYLLSDRTTAPFSKGAGAALISHAKDEARKLGIKRLCLDCWRGNDNKLVHYYEKQGFRLIGNFEAKNWPGAVMEMRL